MMTVGIEYKVEKIGKSWWGVVRKDENRIVKSFKTLEEAEAFYLGILYQAEIIASALI